MSQQRINLEIISPDGMIYAGYVDRVDLPGADGKFTVLPFHTPLIAVLNPGQLRFFGPGRSRSFQVGPGMMKMEKNELVVLVEYAK